MLEIEIIATKKDDLSKLESSSFYVTFSYIYVMFIDHHFINFIIYMLKGGSYIMKKVKIFIQKDGKSIVVGGGFFFFFLSVCYAVLYLMRF